MVHVVSGRPRVQIIDFDFAMLGSPIIDLGVMQHEFRQIFGRSMSANFWENYGFDCSFDRDAFAHLLEVGKAACVLNHLTHVDTSRLVKDAARRWREIFHPVLQPGSR